MLHGAVAHALAHDPVRTAAVDGEVAAAERSFGLLRLLLSGGAVDEPDRVAGLARSSSGAGRW